MGSFNFPEIPTFKMPEIPAVKIDTPLQHMWAGEQFEILKQYISDFEKALDDEHEVGMMLTNFGQSILMQVTNITYEEPVLFIFKGYVNGKESTLIQHMNQLNFMLTSVDKEPERPKRRIGFVVKEE
jgi:hypothetical protein